MIRLILPAMPFRNVEPSEASYYAKNLVNNLPPLLNRSREVMAVDPLERAIEWRGPGPAPALADEGARVSPLTLGPWQLATLLLRP